MSVRAKRRRIAAVVLLVGAYLAAGIVIARVACVSSATLESRHGLRAALLLPGVLRAFPVEKHVTSDEVIEYTMSTVRDDLTRWRLRIDTSPQRAAVWRQAFAGHLRDRGFTNIGTRRSGGGQLSRHTVSGRRYALLRVTNGPGTRFHVMLEYWPSLHRRRPKPPIALMRYYALKIRRALLGKKPAVNTITCPS
jgi:hypothetical protein